MSVGFFSSEENRFKQTEILIKKKFYSDKIYWYRSQKYFLSFQMEFYRFPNKYIYFKQMCFYANLLTLKSN